MDNQNSSNSLKMLRMNFNKLYKFKTLEYYPNLIFYCREFQELDLINLFNKKMNKIEFVVTRIVDLEDFGSGIIRHISVQKFKKIFDSIIEKIKIPKFKIPFVILSKISDKYYFETMVKKYFNPNYCSQIIKICIDENIFNIIVFITNNYKNSIFDKDIFEYALENGSIEIIETLNFLKNSGNISKLIPKVLTRRLDIIVYCLKYFDPKDVLKCLNHCNLSKSEVQSLRSVIVSSS